MTDKEIADHFGRLCEMAAEPNTYGDVGSMESAAIQWAIDRMGKLGKENGELKNMVVQRMQDNAALAKQIMDLTDTFLFREGTSK